MDSALLHFIEPEDFDLPILRYRDMFFIVEGPDGVLELRPTFSGLQGVVFLVVMWLSAFAPVVADLQSSQVCYDPSSKSCICKSPAGTATGGSLTVYADDLAKVFLLQGPWQHKSATASQASDCVATSASALRESWRPAGIAQNKQQTPRPFPRLLGTDLFTHAECS